MTIVEAKDILKSKNKKEIAIASEKFPEEMKKAEQQMAMKRLSKAKKREEKKARKRYTRAINRTTPWVKVRASADDMVLLDSSHPVHTLWANIQDTKKTERIPADVLVNLFIV